MKSFTLAALLASATLAFADPQLTSWFTANTGQYARIYTTNERCLSDDVDGANVASLCGRE
jgi:hypothetical protein